MPFASENDFKAILDELDAMTTLESAVWQSDLCGRQWVTMDSSLVSSSDPPLDNHHVNAIQEFSVAFVQLPFALITLFQLLQLSHLLLASD